MAETARSIGRVAAEVVNRLAEKTGRELPFGVETHIIADRTSWLALRTHDLTASDIPAVIGVDPYRTPLRVYAEKIGLVSGASDNDAMRRGRWLEPAVIEALRETYPDWEVRRAGVYLREPEIRMGATPDAVAIAPDRPGVGIVQCKVVSRPAFERNWPDGRAPLNYEIQTLAEAMLAAADWAMVAALVIDTYSAELVLHDVPRHQGAERRIRDAVQRFWQAVDAGQPPAPIYSEDAEIVDALYPANVPGSSRDLSSDNMLPVLLAERAEIKARMSADEARCKAIDTELKAKIGEAEEASLPGWKISWKAQHRRETVIPATTFRVLRVSDRREKEGIAA
jgi:putative phage-type endonuclease